MGKGYIPRADAEFDTWQNAFVSYAIVNAAALGLTPADVAELSTCRLDWGADYANCQVAQNAARGAVEKKDDTRDNLETAIRRATRKIQARKETTDTQREMLDITVPDTTRTPLSEQIVLTELPPKIDVVCTAPKQVRIDWYPSAVGTEGEEKPQGIDGIAIWYAEGGVPATEGGWRFLALDTNSPYIHNVENTGTITIAYKAQWFDRRKRMGAFCDPIVIAVTG